MEELKRALRLKMLKRRADNPNAARLGALIQEAAWPLLSQSKSVMLYAAFRGEVETRLIAERALASGIEVYYPKIISRRDMTALRICEMGDLRPGLYGILEPSGDISPARLDAVIMPGLAFTRNGARLGYGGGYYDRYLANSDALKIAFAYSFQIVDDVGAGALDVNADYVVTENGIYSGGVAI